VYTSFYRACLLVVGLVFSLTIQAAGLGKLTINSSLGQPLNAEIDLVSVSEEELSTLKAEFASREAFAQAGIRYEPFFPTFQISVESRIDGAPYIKISSPQSVNEPFLNLLVELSWASGRLLREYTVLLDPADTWAPETVAPVVPSMLENTETLAETETEPAQNETEVIAESEVEAPQAHQQSIPSYERYTGNTYGPILEGDTLSSIARQVKPDSVNLNQMLVALFRANREAFIADNMNLLRTGVVLEIPDMQVLAEIGEKEANAEVRVQVNDWHQYRQNLASSTQQLQDADVISQIDAGEITTSVDNAAVTQSAPPEEVLRLSSGEKLPNSQDQADLTAQERIRMMEEDAIARNLALQEANERVAMLEKNIENLQRLLALQDTDLAQAQANAEAQSTVQQSEAERLEVIPTDSESGSDIVASSETELSDEDGFVMDDSIDTDVESEAGLTHLAEDEFEIETGETETIASLTPPAVPVEPVSNPVLLPESEEASLLDPIMNNMTYIGGLSGILLLIMTAVVLKRRRKAAEAELEAENARYQELSSALREKTASVVATDHGSDDTDESGQTEDFFSQEESQDSESDIESSSSSNAEEQADEQSEMTASESLDSEQPIELDFSVENEQTESETEFSLDETSDAMDMDTFDEEKSGDEDTSGSSQKTEDLAMDFDSGVDEGTAETQDVHEDKAETDDENLMDFSSEEPDSAIEESNEMKMDFDEPEGTFEQDAIQDNVAIDESSENVVEPESKSDVDNGLDFSLDDSAIDLTDEVQESDEAISEESSLDQEMNELELPEMDLSSETLESEAPSVDDNSDSSDIEDKAPEIDFEDINLDIEENPETDDNPVDEAENSAEAAEESPEAEAKSEQWHEIETKVDLAKAYIEMEDVEGAREMLEEVVQEGDENQQNTAKELLEKL